MYIILNLVNASSVISNTAKTTFTPILLPAITRTLLLPHFWHNYYKAQEKVGTSGQLFYHALIGLHLGRLRLGMNTHLLALSCIWLGQIMMHDRWTSAASLENKRIPVQLSPPLGISLKCNFHPSVKCSQLFFKTVNQAIQMQSSYYLALFQLLLLPSKFCNGNT